MSNLNRIIRGRRDKLNILTFPTHERYETNLSLTGHNFYSFHIKGSKKWNYEHMPPPENYHILPEEQLCSFIGYDLILSQSKYWQYQVAQQINRQLGLPLICLEHTVPTPNVHSEEQITELKKMYGLVNVYISQYSKEQWNGPDSSVIIHHGVDNNTFRDTGLKRNNTILTVANDFKNRDYCLGYTLWQEVTQGFETKLIGESEGLSLPAKDNDELRDAYNTASIYFNSTTLSPIPTTVLEAMACGCAIVSTATCAIPEFVEHGVGGLLSNDPLQLREYIKHLQENPEIARKMGQHNANYIRNNM